MDSTNNSNKNNVNPRNYRGQQIKTASVTHSFRHSGDFFSLQIPPLFLNIKCFGRLK
jgi:hypothetical protein